MAKAIVEISRRAMKEINKAPDYIVEAVQKWVESIERIGLEETRRLGGKGLHDEPLKGELLGLRSVRLNRDWRLYYSRQNGSPVIVSIERVDKHEY